jgi:hypothetical protein
MPLDNDSRLRVQILECHKNAVFQAVSDYGFGTPIFVSMLPRVTHNGMALAAVYEIDLPRDAQPIPDDRSGR